MNHKHIFIELDGRITSSEGIHITLWCKYCGIIGKKIKAHYGKTLLKKYDSRSDVSCISDNEKIIKDLLE